MTNIVLPPVPGRVYFPALAASPTTLQVAADTFYAVPFKPVSLRIDQIGVRVTTAGSANAAIRLAIYADRDGRPGRLFNAFAPLGGLNSTGAKAISFAPALGLSMSGTLWLALLASAADTQPVLAAIGASLVTTGAYGVGDFAGLPSAAGDIASGVKADLPYAEFPAHAPATMPVASAVPLIGVRAV